jgi:hypothetical protein
MKRVDDQSLGYVELHQFSIWYVTIHSLRFRYWSNDFKKIKNVIIDWSQKQAKVQNDVLEFIKTE